MLHCVTVAQNSLNFVACQIWNSDSSSSSNLFQIFILSQLYCKICADCVESKIDPWLWANCRQWLDWWTRENWSMWWVRMWMAFIWDQGFHAKCWLNFMAIALLKDAGDVDMNTSGNLKLKLWAKLPSFQIHSIILAVLGLTFIGETEL